VRLLVDTHAFLWAVLEDQKLSGEARSQWLSPDSELLISPTSLWEIAIKVALGKLKLRGTTREFFERELRSNSLTLLPIAPAHAARVATLPHHHGDPFDRMLVAQALCEDLPVLSADVAFDAYGVARVW
jgi:PIN domain nuclease of toxin-antitoxin system